MNERLANLPEAQKKAVVMLACTVEAQSKNGTFKTNDPEVDVIAEACFRSDWEGFSNPFYKHTYFYEAATADMNECIRVASGMDDAGKYAFKVLLGEIAQNNAYRVLAMAGILQKIGFKPYVNPTPKTRTTDEDAQEDDGTYIVKDPFYGRIIDDTAVRGENNEVFTLKTSVSDVGERVGANYEQWMKDRVCPAKGLVGYSVKRVRTDEGPLQYLNCHIGGEKWMVIPILERGLEKIDKWANEDKEVNNKILAYDPRGERCMALRVKAKESTGTIKEYQASQPSGYQDKTVIHFDAVYLERLEPGNHRGPDYMPRRIDLTYTNLGRDVVIEVKQTMKPRYARIENDNGVTLTYRDINAPVCYYEVETSPVDGSVVRVSIFQPNEFGQKKEYRYTI